MDLYQKCFCWLAYTDIMEWPQGGGLKGVICSLPQYSSPLSFLLFAFLHSLHILSSHSPPLQELTNFHLRGGPRCRQDEEREALPRPTAQDHKPPTPHPYSPPTSSNGPKAPLGPFPEGPPPPKDAESDLPRDPLWRLQQAVFPRG